MANIPLQSMTFPGLSDKYITPTVDATLTQTGAAADAKKTGDEISGLKNDLNQFPNGTYPNMSVGNADQLTATVGIEDTTPYLFRTSGGSVDIGDREDVRKIVGGTIVNNQAINIQTYTNTLTDAAGTVRLSLRESKPPFTQVSYDWASNAKTIEKIISVSDTFTGLELVHSGSTVNFNIWKDANYEIIAGHKYFYIADITQTDITTVGGFIISNLQFTDLTKMFGTSIADYVYSLEQATAGAGVAWLKTHFPKQFNSGYQAYDAGSLQSVSGLTAHKMVGFNQWDEEWELGDLNTNNGANYPDSTRIRSKNYIPVLPSTTYYFKCPNGAVSCYYDINKTYINKGNNTLTANSDFVVPANAYYLRFGVSSTYGNTYNHDICINLHWDGERDGEYEPYQEWVYALDSSLTLRGIPKLDTNNNLYYDGDEYLPDGTVNRRYGLVDLGTLNWVASTNSRYNTNTPIPGAIGVSTDLRCVKYIPDMGASTRTVDKSVCITNQGYIYIYDTTQTGDANAFKTAMSGVYLLYPLATPTTETADAYQETQIVDDFGTEEFVLADTAFPVPVGHETYYKNNLRAKLEMSPESPNGDGLYVVQQESGENTYVPLASTATIQDILTRLTALENA